MYVSRHGCVCSRDVDFMISARSVLVCCSLHGTLFFFFWQGPSSKTYGRTAALRLIVQPCDKDEEKDDFFFSFPSNGAPVEWNWPGKTEVFGEKPVPVPLCQSKIPHGLARGRTRASAVGMEHLLNDQFTFIKCKHNCSALCSHCLSKLLAAILNQFNPIYKLRNCFIKITFETSSSRESFQPDTSEFLFPQFMLRISTIYSINVIGVYKQWGGLATSRTTWVQFTTHSSAKINNAPTYLFIYLWFI
jgi:hypothetical protein